MLKNQSHSAKVIPLLFLATLVLMILNMGFQSGHISILAFGLFLVFFYHAAYWIPATFIFALPLSFLLLTEIFSLVLIENGAYMYEVDEYGIATGATSRLVFLYVVVFCIAGFFSEKKWRSFLSLEDPFAIAKHRHRKTLALMIVSGISLVLLYYFYYGLTNGFPIFTQQDRFAYRRDFYDPVFNLLFSNRLIFTALISMLPAIGYKKIADSLILILILLSALFSEKFTSIVQIIIIYYIPSLIGDLRRQGEMRVDRAFLIVISVLFITLPIALLVYGAQDDFYGSVERLLSRMAVQGQMWFVSDRDYFSFWGFNWGAAWEELQSLVMIDDQLIIQQLSHGRYFVMQHFIDNETLAWVMEIDQGTVFTLLPSWLINYGYIPTFILVCLLAVFLGFCLQQMMRAYLVFDLLTVCITHKAYIWLVAGITNGYAFYIFGIKIVIMLITAALASYALRYSRIKRGVAAISRV